MKATPTTPTLVDMHTLLIPLHGMAHGGPFFLVPFLFGTLLLALVAFRLARTGRVGPVRLEGATGASGPPGGRRRPAWGRTPEDEALATLKHRLASGDISPQEYLERTQVLRRPHNPEN